MSGQRRRDASRRIGLPAYAQVQRLQALQQHPGVERRHRRAGLPQQHVDIVLNELSPNRESRRRDSGPARRCAWSPNRRRSRRRARAGSATAVWRTRYRPPALPPPHGRSRRPRRCRSLQGSDWSGFRGKTTLVLGRTALRHWSRSTPSTRVDGDAEPRQEVLDHPAAGAEHRLGGDDVVAGLDLADQGGVDRGHTARGRPRRLGAFERGHAIFEHRDGRIGEPGIEVSGIVPMKRASHCSATS